MNSYAISIPIPREMEWDMSEDDIWLAQFELDMEVEFFRLSLGRIGEMEDEITEEYVCGDQSVTYEVTCKLKTHNEMRHIKQDAENVEYDDPGFPVDDSDLVDVTP